MRSVINIYNKRIIINTNVEIVKRSVVNNFTGYITPDDNKTTDLTFNIIIDEELYNNSNIQHLCSINYSDDNMYLTHKKNIVIINQKKRKISIIISTIDNNILDDINRIILNFTYKLLEKENVFFIEAACIADENKAIIFIGDKNFNKDIIYNLLKTDYNYVSVESVGIRNNDNDDIEIVNLPEKTKMKQTYSKKIVTGTILKKIIVLESNMVLQKFECKQIEEEEFERLIKLQHDKHEKKYISYIEKIYNKYGIINYNKIYNNVNMIKLLYNRNNFTDTYRFVKKIIK